MNADSVLTGKHELSKDNLTEHLNTINIFSRFNIHQELFLATVYKMYDFGMKPILFYVEFVFSMQGFYMGIIMTLCWALSGSWLPSVLTAAFITCHRYWNHRSFQEALNTVNIISVYLQITAMYNWFQVLGNKGREHHSSKGTLVNAICVCTISDCRILPRLLQAPKNKF